MSILAGYDVKCNRDILQMNPSVI